MSGQQTSEPRLHPSALIIGGGVAGSTCAIRLRKHGIRVQLAEKSSFPRAKVCGCCLGGAGLETLRELGLETQVLQRGVAITKWQASLGNQRVQIDLPTGVAISREALDTLLLDAARESGCDVITPCTATLDSVAKESVNVTLTTNGQANSHSYDLVVVAAGLNGGGVSSFLPFTEKPHGPFGVSWTARCDVGAAVSRTVESLQATYRADTSSAGLRTEPEGKTPARGVASATDFVNNHTPDDAFSPHVIYMACDNDGYVGLVRLEDDRVDIAAALQSGSSAARLGTPRQRVLQILERSEFPSWQFHDESTCLTTPPLRRTRQAGSGRLIAIGDAAGYSEPFTGEGMTWAMQTAIASADLIAESIDTDRCMLSDIGDRWQQKLPTLLRRNKLACRAVTSVLRWPAARRAVGSTLSRWPTLADPLIRHLSHRS